jgi:hypothetical protein
LQVFPAPTFRYLQHASCAQPSCVRLFCQRHSPVLSAGLSLSSCYYFLE